MTKVRLKMEHEFDTDKTQEEMLKFMEELRELISKNGFTNVAGSLRKIDKDEN